MVVQSQDVLLLNTIVVQYLYTVIKEYCSTVVIE